MKVDVIACYYRQAHLAPFFFWGIHENIEEIGKLIIVNDEPWNDAELVQVMAHAGEIGVETACLEHTHKGTHGVASSFNQGAAYSQNEYVFFTSFDQILTPGTLCEITDMASIQRMVLGRVDSISTSTGLDDLPNPTIIRPDIYANSIEQIKQGVLVVGCWRNGHTLVHRPSHLRLGGFNEKFVEWGYGLEDQDYCIRWLIEYGLDSILWGDSNSWHFAGNRPSAEDPKKSDWHPEAVKTVNNNLNRLYKKYKVQASKQSYFQRNNNA